MLYWYYLAFISASFMAIATVLEKNMLKTQHATVYSAEFSIVTMALSLIFLPFANFNVSTSALIVLYILSLISTITYLLTAKVYRHSYVSLATPMFSSLPILFAVILAFIFLGEKLTSLQYVSIVIILVAAYLLLSGDKSLENKTSGGKTYMSLVLITALLGAIGYVIMKYLLAIKVDPFAFLIISGIFTALNITLYMTIKYGGLKEIIDNIKKYEISILALSLLTIFYRITFYLSVLSVAVSLALPLRNAINVILSVFFGGIIFKESSIYKKLVLSLVIVIFSYLLII